MSRRSAFRRERSTDRLTVARRKIAETEPIMLNRLARLHLRLCPDLDISPSLPPAPLEEERAVQSMLILTRILDASLLALDRFDIDLARDRMAPSPPEMIA